MGFVVVCVVIQSNQASSFDLVFTKKRKFATYKAKDLEMDSPIPSPAPVTKIFLPIRAFLAGW